jgi:hypothetical protein
LNWLVFRGGRERFELASELGLLRQELKRGAGLSALLRAGLIEAGLADQQHALAGRAAELTDALAGVWLREGDGRSVLELAQGWSSNPGFEASVPEGYAYYGIHPRDYAAAGARLLPPARDAFVLGLRSIGTSLSAVVAATLRHHGARVTRATARPSGHPFAREVVLDAESVLNARASARSGGLCIIVDEGPGQSGSSLLGAVDSLTEAGIRPEQIEVMCSHPAEPTKLIARDAARRWRALSVTVASTERPRLSTSAREISAGAWRTELTGLARIPDADWAAAWTTFERRKFLDEERGAILKFDGLDPWGEAVRSRARRLAELGIGPRLLDCPESREDGYTAYARLRQGTDWPPRVPVWRLAEVVAARREFPCDPSSQQLRALAEMLEHNVSQLKLRCRLPPLSVEVPVICDGRLNPCEWVESHGTYLKVDNASHGDDHFFPGPCDIAWDVAGAIIEWQLGRGERATFLEEYSRRADDRSIGLRLPAWELAYLAFRYGWSSMAAAAAPEEEQPRLLRERARYARAIQVVASASQPL